MFFLETTRLKLIPLNHQQLLLYCTDRVVLENRLGLNLSNMHIDPVFRQEMDEAMQNFWLPNTKAYPDLYQWYTNWEIVLKKINTSIGGIGFGGYPDDYGATTVGYVIDKQHQGNGYATEALLTLLQWGFSFSVLKAVKADTTTDNTSSQNVLIKTGFKQIGIRNNILYYQRIK